MLCSCIRTIIRTWSAPSHQSGVTLYCSKYTWPPSQAGFFIVLCVIPSSFPPLCLHLHFFSPVSPFPFLPIWNLIKLESKPPSPAQNLSYSYREPHWCLYTGRETQYLSTHSVFFFSNLWVKYQIFSLDTQALKKSPAYWIAVITLDTRV